MYKLQVHAGLGDCLRIINNCRIVTRCKKEKTRCYINYKIIKDESWVYTNRDTFIKLIENVHIFDYIDEVTFDACPAALANAKEEIYTQETLLPLPIHSTVSRLPEQFDATKVHITVQLTGSTQNKAFSNHQLYSIFSAFSGDAILFHILDHPNKFVKNKELFANFNNVICRELDFNDNYKLVTLCDLLLAPDSFSKYAMLAADKKGVLVCNKLHYIGTPTGMFEYAFVGITNNPKVIILGWKNKTKLVNKVSDFSSDKIIKAIRDLIATA